MNKFLSALKQRLLNAITPGIGAILWTLQKFEALIEDIIECEELKLMQLDAAAKALAARIKQKNADVDAAYKLLHKVAEMGK